VEKKSTQIFTASRLKFNITSSTVRSRQCAVGNPSIPVSAIKELKVENDRLKFENEK
jgi:hypothetical protein